MPQYKVLSHICHEDVEYAVGAEVTMDEWVAELHGKSLSPVAPPTPPAAEPTKPAAEPAEQSATEPGGNIVLPPATGPLPEALLTME